MDESLILKAAALTNGGSEPSGLDENVRRTILTSRSFRTAQSELPKTFALFVKRLCLEEIRNAESLESFVACRLISLDKRPGLRATREGVKLRRIAGKDLQQWFYWKNMSLKPQDCYNYVDSKLPDLKPRHTKCIFSMMITQKVFY